MEIPCIKALLDCIDQFSNLSSKNVVTSDILARYRGEIDELLMLLKPIIEGATTADVSMDADLLKLLEYLHTSIDDSRMLVESYHQMSSKVNFVLQIESVILKIQANALDACSSLISLFHSTEINFDFEHAKHCLEKLQGTSYRQMSSFIHQAVREQMETGKPKHITMIQDSLNLSTNQDLLMEIVALDKLKASLSRENHGKIEHHDQIISLVMYMHDCYVEKHQVHSINNITIPSDFCCPLSLDLMSDPVIVASGQTYERSFIKKWLEQGCTVCPKTRQTLAHTNLIPNYTVKALIANWCETNNIKLPDPSKLQKHPGNSTGTSSSKSPESHCSTVNLGRDGLSPNGSLKESCLNEKLTLPLSQVSLSTSQTAGSSQTSADKLPFSSLEIGGTSSHQLDDSSQVAREQGHSRSSSASSSVDNGHQSRGISNGDALTRVPGDPTHYSSDASGELRRESPVHNVPSRDVGLTLRLGESRMRGSGIWGRPPERFSQRILSSPTVDSRPDLSGVESQVRKLIQDLESDSTDNQRAAAAELRLLAKHSTENRIVIANCGAISHLVRLLYSSDLKTQENAVTALLNLSINDNNKTLIANADSIDPLIHALKTGNPEAKENSAATLFSLSVIEENKIKIGRSGAIGPLVELLGNGTPRGKKDAATALFNLSIFHENKARIVQAGAVRHLVELMDPAAGMVDKAVAVLANLATIPEGRSAIGREGGIRVLVEVVELGSQRGKENAAAALLHLCTNSSKFCGLVLQEGVVPPLVALLQSGTPRAKEKAQSLLSYFKNQRHNPGRG